MSKIDVKALIEAKAPRFAPYIPNMVINKLIRIVRQNELNRVIELFGKFSPQKFVQSFFNDVDVTYSIEGLDKLPIDQKFLFVSNHPFGGMDGMMIADKLIDHFGDARVVVNDVLMQVDALRPIWIPVNKYGKQSQESVRKFDEAFFGNFPILTFPAGLCSRRKNGVVADLEWKNSFLKRAKASQRQIVPMYVEGELSNFFYRLSNIRQMLGVKFNIEMLWLCDEMFNQKGKHFRIIVGEPISREELEKCGSFKEQSEYVRKKTYFLKNKLSQ